MSIEVNFTDLDIIKIYEYAEGRNNRSLAKGYQPKYGQSNETTKNDHIIGTAGEYAVSKYFNIPYNKFSPHDGSNDLSKSDLIDGWQIRTTYYKNGRLVAHRGEDKKMKYVLIFVNIEKKFAKIIGWSWGHDLMKEENWGDHFRTGRPCYALQQHELSDFDVKKTKSLFQNIN